MLKSALSYQTDNEEYEVMDCFINEYEGQVFISKTGKDNKIVWATTDASICIIAPLDKRELIKIAKKMK